MILAWIIHATIMNISDHITFSSRTHDAWVELQKNYGQADGTRIFEVQRDPYSISQNNLSVADYFPEIKKLWDVYNSVINIRHYKCGMECASFVAVHKMVENQQLMLFLVCLNEQNKTVGGNMIMMKPLPTFSQAYNVILQEEKQRGLNSTSYIASHFTICNAREQYTTKSNNVVGPEHVARVR